MFTIESDAIWFHFKTHLLAIVAGVTTANKVKSPKKINANTNTTCFRDMIYNVIQGSLQQRSCFKHVNTRNATVSNSKTKHYYKLMRSQIESLSVSNESSLKRIAFFKADFSLKLQSLLRPRMVTLG